MIGQDQAENRESQRSRTNLSSKSRINLNISLIKTLTAIADRPTVYVSVTPPCYNFQIFIRKQISRISALRDSAALILGVFGLLGGILVR